MNFEQDEDEGLLTGGERVAIWEQYKSEHPNPELIPDSDFGYVNRLLKAQLAKDNQKIEELFKEIKILVLQSIADEPEYPSDMPDELWQELSGNREKVMQAMRSTVRLTKNGITDRFLQSLKDKYGALIPDDELRTKIEKHFGEYEWMGTEDWKHLKGK